MPRSEPIPANRRRPRKRLTSTLKGNGSGFESLAAHPIGSGQAGTDSRVVNRATIVIVSPQYGQARRAAAGERFAEREPAGMVIEHTTNNALGTMTWWQRVVCGRLGWHWYPCVSGVGH
jgi:hypothetical protein